MTATTNAEEKEGVMGEEKRKVSVYLEEGTREELEGEAARQERTMSWLMVQAWKIAYPHIRAVPGVEDDPEDP